MEKLKKKREKQAKAVGVPGFEDLNDDTSDSSSDDERQFLLSKKRGLGLFGMVQKKDQQ